MCYFSLAFNNPTEVIDSICHQLDNPQLGTVDHIVGTGISGTILLIPISIKSGIPCCVVRKKEYNHSFRNVETGEQDNHVYKYAIIDDFIESGKTINRIINSMNLHRPSSQCVCIITYQQAKDKKYSMDHKEIPVVTLKESILELVDLRRNKT